MPMRFKLLTTLVMVVVLMAHGGSAEMFSSMVEVFVGLGLLLIVCVVSLWPNEGRADRAERQANKSGWADRLDIEAMADKSTSERSID
ncbi:MAG: hypothetical protein AAFR75_00575 [Pseudomonadota bacterium]